MTSIKEDNNIFEEDLDGTEAHDIMLCEQGIISKEELAKILSVLEKLRQEKHKGTIKLDSKYEDIHELIEDHVITEIGREIGGKLHTGRSRNDQVALDIRMHLRSELNDTSELILSLVDMLLKCAKEYEKIPMMLYTHTQHAQIGSFSHYLISYADFLIRDFQRLQDCYDRVNLSPLGSGPVGGTSIAINRNRTAFLLGFDGIVENSIDAVSARDFMLEAASVLAILMSGLSKIVEDLILWSTAEFGYIELDDKYASVSSIMPQKKNPNVLELIRGKSGNVYGSLVALFTILKGLPSGYNSDLQETKQPLWDAIDTVRNSLDILIDVVRTLKIKENRMLEIISDSYAFAVDLAELLSTETSLSFREAHMVVGNLIKEMLAKGTNSRDFNAITIVDLAWKILKKKIEVNETLVKQATDANMILMNRKSIGNPSPTEIKRMLKIREERLRDFRMRVAARSGQIKQANDRLKVTVKKYI